MFLLGLFQEKEERSRDIFEEDEKQFEEQTKPIKEAFKDAEKYLEDKRKNK